MQGGMMTDQRNRRGPRDEARNEALPQEALGKTILKGPIPMHRRRLIALVPAVFAAPALLAGSTVQAAQRQGGLPRSVNHTDGVALAGYDTVAWFAEGAPRRGNPAFLAEHAGIAWHFASAANLARFEAAPAAHAPRFGGFCAYGVAQGYKVDIDPEAWHIRNGMLFLNHDRGVQRRWLRDVPGYLARAEANWPRLAEA